MLLSARLGRAGRKKGAVITNIGSRCARGMFALYSNGLPLQIHRAHLPVLLAAFVVLEVGNNYEMNLGFIA